MTLSDAQTACLSAIIDADQAWSLWSDLESRFGSDVLAELLLLELIAPWQRPDYLAVTLTPYAAWALACVIEEPRWEFVETAEPQWQGPDRPERLVRVKRAEAVPEWVRCESIDEESGNPVRPTSLVVMNGVGRRRERPVVLPRYGGECPLRLPDRLHPEAPPEPEPEFDPPAANGRDWSRIRLFAGGREGKGIPVEPPKPRRQKRSTQVS